jgi:hypothetical protein
MFGNEKPPGLQVDKNAPEGLDAQQGETRSLASLPEELQKAIRQALKGLDVKDPEKKEEGNVPPDPNQLALHSPDDASSKTPSLTAEGKNPSQGKEQQGMGRAGDRGDNKGKGNNTPSSHGGMAQPPAQGSGMQQLDQARLDRKNARGQFQPDSPQIPGRGDAAGEGGTGAGSGTDPRLYGNPTDLGGGAHTFQLALDATHERVASTDPRDEEEKYEGGVIDKSTKNLSQKQSMDDAIRKAQVPPEYEEIVKRLFSRGESQ